MSNYHDHADTRQSTAPGLIADFDVVVVGARAAGAATAMLLARRGMRVLAVDRSAYGSDTLSTHSLARVGVLQLSRWGVLDRIREEGTPVAQTVVFHYDDEPMVVDVSGPGDVDGLYSPRRTVLDRVLVDEARASGAEVLHGVSVRGVTTDAAGRVNGVDVDIDASRCRIGARWVVGADGVRSRVARAVGARETHREAAGTSVMYGYWSGLGDELHNFYDQQGRAAGVIPTNDGHACVWVAVTPDEFAARSWGDVRTAYRAAIGASPRLAALLAGAEYVGGVRGFSGRPGFLREPVGPGWALVGDAGYFKDPVSAHGITDAFTSAEFLVDAIADAHFGAEEEMTALTGYRDQRDQLAAELMPPIAALAALDLQPDGARVAFKQFSRALRHEWDVMSARDLVSV